LICSDATCFEGLSLGAMTTGMGEVVYNKEEFDEAAKHRPVLNRP
jgi:hypothetical protein